MHLFTSRRATSATSRPPSGHPRNFGQIPPSGPGSAGTRVCQRASTRGGRREPNVIRVAMGKHTVRAQGRFRSEKQAFRGLQHGDRSGGPDAARVGVATATRATEPASMTRQTARIPSRLGCQDVVRFLATLLSFPSLRSLVSAIRTDGSGLRCLLPPRPRGDDRVARTTSWCPDHPGGSSRHRCFRVSNRGHRHVRDLIASLRSATHASPWHRGKPTTELSRSVPNPTGESLIPDAGTSGAPRGAHTTVEAQDPRARRFAGRSSCPPSTTST